jgi:DNA-binding transcriptional ArsR family regulator
MHNLLEISPKGYPLNAPASPQHLDLIFGALADPTRRAILDRLADGERSVMELVAGFDLSQPAVSKHLKVLEKSGLIARERDGQFRPCRLNPDGLERAASWLGNYRRFWEESLDQLDAYVKELQRKEQAQQKQAPTKKPPPQRSPKPAQQEKK